MLDSFDTAFLVLTGYVQFVPIEVLVMKAAQAVKKDVILWGPESKLIAYMLKKAWKKHGIKLTDAVIAAFDLTGDISVEPKKVKAAFKKYGNVGEEVTRMTKKKVLQTLARIAKKATKHYKKQIEKARVRKQEEKELWAILGGQLDTYVEMYPDRVLTKEVERLVTLTMTAPDRRAVNAITLRNRIENIANHPLNYMDNVSDIHAGRAWHFTGLRMAQSEGITTAIVIAQEDKVTCPVCRRLDGRRIEVARSIERMEEALSLTDPDEISKALPFPRVHNLDNMSPKQIMDAGWTIPFHARCRCDFEYLWSEGIRVAEPEVKLSERSERALATYKPCTRDVQVIALANEKRLVHMIPGAKSIGGKKPFDVWVTPARRKKPTDVIEVKTIVRGKNNKITMHKDSLARKNEEIKGLGNPKVHTVVFDERTGKYYYREGLGSFRLTQMTEVNTLEELEYLITKKKKTYKKVLSSLEANIRHKKDREILYAINKKGDVVFTKEGTKSAVSFTEKERRLFRGVNWTHNHPSENSFSADDIYMMIANETPECRAVCSSYRYSAKIDWKAAAKFPRVKGDRQALVNWILNEDYAYAHKKVKSILQQAVNHGTLSVEEAQAMHFHKVWAIVAKRNPFFSYKRTDW